MKATRTRHGCVHMFTTHRPTLTLQLHIMLFRTCRTALLRGNWQNFTWHDTSRGPSAIAELLVIIWNFPELSVLEMEARGYSVSPKMAWLTSLQDVPSDIVYISIWVFSKRGSVKVIENGTIVWGGCDLLIDVCCDVIGRIFALKHQLLHTLFAVRWIIDLVVWTASTLRQHTTRQ